MSKVTTTFADGTSIDAVYDVGVPMPVFPEVKWADLAPVADEHYGKTLKRAKAGSQVLLLANAKLSSIGNSDVNMWQAIVTNVSALIGVQGAPAVIQMLADSFTNYADPPSWPGQTLGAGALRWGPNNGTLNPRAPISMSDLTFIGADQHHGAIRMLWMGIYNYMSKGAVAKRITLQRMSSSNGNSPKYGETFAWTEYLTDGSYLDDFVISGLDPITGARVGGGLFGAAGAKNLRIKNMRATDSDRSGVSLSRAGTDPAKWTVTDTVTIDGLTVLNNANHKENAGTPEWRFAPVNLEDVHGLISISGLVAGIDPYVSAGWDATMISHGSAQYDNPTPMLVQPVSWTSPSWAQGAFSIALWGKQVTRPIVKDTSGKILQPVFVESTPTGGAGVTLAMVPKIDPKTQYALVHRNDYTA
ncbi:hypothetical protein [Subtercola sp. YIM 133946]|uniref:hypothetical protein n=1 Tax=Subtercola sp. YIM 133946 TaxID=3118909 RepID=UPI002F94DF05